MSAYDAPAVRAAAERIWDGILPADLRTPTSHGINLNAVAKRLGVSDILYHPDRHEGRTDWSNGRIVVHLAKGKSQSRRRFTLAHELGHVLCRVAPMVTDAAGQMSVTDLVDAHDEEWLCDVLAAELIAPARSTRRLLAQADGLPDLAAMSAYAQVYRVSLSVVANRLSGYGWKRPLLALKKDDRQDTHHQWSLLSRAGHTPSLWRCAIRVHAVDDVAGNGPAIVTLELRRPGSPGQMVLARCDAMEMPNVTHALVNSWRPLN